MFLITARKSQKVSGLCVAGSNPARPASSSEIPTEARIPSSGHDPTTASSLQSWRGSGEEDRNGEGSVYRRKDGLWVGQYKVQSPYRTDEEDDQMRATSGQAGV
jgi:hypothetical protein